MTATVQTLDGSRSVSTEVKLPFVPAFSVSKERTFMSIHRNVEHILVRGLYDVQHLVVQLDGATIMPQRRNSDGRNLKWKLPTLTLKQTGAPVGGESGPGIVHLRLELASYGGSAPAEAPLNSTFVLMHKITGQRRVVDVVVSYDAGSSAQDAAQAVTGTQRLLPSGAEPNSADVQRQLLLVAAIVLFALLIALGIALVRAPKPAANSARTNNDRDQADDQDTTFQYGTPFNGSATGHGSALRAITPSSRPRGVPSRTQARFDTSYAGSSPPSS